MDIDIEGVCALAGDDMSDKARKTSIASRRQWLRRRGLVPTGTTVRIVKRGKGTMRIPAMTWDERAVRDELARIVPTGLAAASDETRRAVAQSSWSVTARRPRNGVA